MSPSTSGPPPSRPQDGAGAARAAPRWRHQWPLLLLLLGLALSALTAWQQHHDNLQARSQALRADAEHLADELGLRMGRFELGLRGARGAVLTVGPARLDRAAFARYAQSRDLLQEFPGARGFGFIRRVPAAALPAFSAAAAADGWPGFQPRQLQPHAGEQFVIQYLEPVAGNAAAVGLDIASEDRRRRAALAAARSGEATLTEPITLVQATGAVQQSFLVLLPVQQPGLPVQTPEQRWAATVGWVYAPLVTADMLRGLFVPAGVRLSLTDVGGDTAPAGPVPFFGPARPAVHEFTETLQRPVLGRPWQLQLHAGPVYLAQLNQTSAASVLLLGALLSLLGAALLAAQIQVQRNRRLALREQERLAALVAQSSDAMVTEDRQGHVTGWNRSAEQLFGHALPQVQGQALARLLLPVAEQARAEAERQAALAGQAVAPRDIVALHRDGSLREVSQLLTLLRGADGQVVGLGRTLRDIRERTRIERERSAFTAELERQVAERTAQLDAAGRQLQTVFDALPSLIAYWDSGLVLRIANLAYHRWFGAPAGSLPGTPVQALLSPALLQAYLPRMRAALAGEEQRFDLTVTPPAGGEDRHIQGRYLPDRRADGTVQGLFVLVHDVTEIDDSRRRLADALREHEALVHTLRSHTLYSVSDAEGRIIEVNDSFCEATGYSRDELVGHDHGVVSSGTHAPAFWAGMWRALVRGEAWRGQVCNRHRSGRLVWMDTMIAPFLAPDGQAQHYVAIRHDITDSRAAAHTLARERERLHNVLRGSDLGTWEWNVQTGEARFDERWAQFTGHRLAELLPTSIETWRGLVHPEDLAQSRAVLARHYSGELPYYECEARLRHRDGHWVWVLGRGRVFTRTPDGQPEWMYGTHQDVSTRRATEEALRLASREAEAASKAKSAFLANMSHEVRTPLNAMIGLTALLAHSPLDADQQGLVGQVQRASQSLLVVVNDVLDLAKIEAGEMRLEHVPFALAERVQSVAALHGAQARAKGLHFSVTLAPGLPHWVRSDPNRLDQLLHNLLANAVKFTAAGQVRLVLREDTERAAAHPADADADAQPLWLRLEVQDTGIGIAQADQAAIFEPFAQADVSTTRRFGGTGLGLSIVRQVCSLMGGELGVDSSPGQGSCFWLRLPLGRVDAEAAARLAGAGTPGALGTTLFGPVSVASTPDRGEGGPERPGHPRRPRALGSVRVLVVDDSDINRDIAQRFLQVAGAQTRGCASATEALALLQHGPAAFDAVLMDVQMPGMDGLEATRRLRELPGLARLPVVALTAGALPQQRDQALAAGMDAFLGKPLDPVTLVQTLKRVVEVARGQPLPEDLVADAGGDALPWPVLPGVDGPATARRLGGDVGLFTRLLARLLAEFGDLAVLPLPASGHPPGDTPGDPDCADEPQARLALAARAHKLRGSAGLLGATRVQAAAERLEALLRTAQPHPARVLRKRQALATAVQHLAQASAPLLAQPPQAHPVDGVTLPPHDTSGAASPDPPIDAALQRLRQQLQGNELNAQDTLRALVPALQTRWDADRLAGLLAAVDRLDFRQALAWLDAQSAPADTGGTAAPAGARAGGPAGAAAAEGGVATVGG